jgi:hypothetical protein
MEKKQDTIEKLLTDALDLKDKANSNALYIEISDKLASKDKEENAKAVAAVLKVEEKTGKEPEFEIPGVLGVKRSLGQDIRDGLISPTKDSQDLYELNKKEPLPGKKDLSDQEIAYRDIEIGLKAAGYESGTKPSSKDQMALDILGGKSQEDKLNPAPLGDQENDMTFGPSRVIKGLLTQDPKEVTKGLEETIKVGAAQSLKENLLDLSPVFKPMQKLSELIGQSVTGKEQGKEGTSNYLFDDTLTVADQQAKVGKDGLKLEDIFNARKDPFHPDQINPSLEDLRETLGKINDKGTALIGEISDAFKTGKVGKEINALIDVSKNGSLEDVEKHVENLFGRAGKKLQETLGEDEDPKKKPEGPKEDEPNWSARLAGSIAGASTYKAGRSKGVNPKKAGEMASVAEDEATDIAKSTKENDQSKDKSVDMAKDAKNMMAKTAAQVADKIPAPPGLGKAIAVGIIIADKATDMLMDLINNKGGADILNKAGGSLEGAEKQKSDPAQQAMGGSIDVFKQEMKKTKGGMVKKLIPTTDDVATTAMKGAVDGVMSWGKDQTNGSKSKPVDEVHRQLDQPS